MLTNWLGSICACNKHLLEQNSLDFDDLLVKVHELFSNNPEIANLWAKKYSYIMVDEFQDTSRIVYDIVKFTTTPSTQLTIVGDPDQTIYTWRGADVNLILNFDKDYKNTKTVILNENYRSTQKILDKLNNLIKTVKIVSTKDLITENEDGDSIHYSHAFSNETRARWVVQNINKQKQKSNLKHSNFLSFNLLFTHAIEEELIKENINHKIFNGLKFYQRKSKRCSFIFKINIWRTFSAFSHNQHTCAQN